MPAWNSIENVVTGIVRSVNDKGLKLEGHDEWMNYSKYAVGIVAPERGSAVACTLDKAGFLRAVDVVDSLPAPVSGGSDAPSATAAPSTRDRTITRLAVLKAAAEFGAARGNLRSGEVLKIAASWERWINRESSAEDEIVDAF